jgi:hypothetical protein
VIGKTCLRMTAFAQPLDICHQVWQMSILLLI